MTIREGVMAVVLMVSLYVAAFAGGYMTARAKLDTLLEMGCRMRCVQIAPVVPQDKGDAPTPPGYKGPSSRT